jgi:anti-sigma28 factor (negative regulator of flagellin synthesis)
LVNRLRYQISEGRYFVPTEEIVEKLLGRLLVAAAY